MDKKTYSVIVLEDNPSLEIKRGDILKLFTNDEYKVLYENISLPIVSSDLNIDLDTWCDMLKVKILSVEVGDTVMCIDFKNVSDFLDLPNDMDEIIIPGTLGIVDRIFLGDDGIIKCEIHNYLDKTCNVSFTVFIDKLKKGVWTEND